MTHSWEAFEDEDHRQLYLLETDKEPIFISDKIEHTNIRNLMRIRKGKLWKTKMKTKPLE